MSARPSTARPGSLPGRVRLILAGVALLLAAFVAFWILSAPDPLPAASLPAHRPDLTNGRTLFDAASCRACHAAAGQRLGEHGLPEGGKPFPTPIGTLFPGNLTPDPETGLGRWTDIEFVNAVTRGLSPEGRHYVPAFPYGSYRFMTLEDVLDVLGYLRSLPAVRSPGRKARLPIAGVVRRGIGLWNRVALGAPPFVLDPTRAAWSRGAYLANAPGHCGECHTPRNLIMVPDRQRLFAGGPHPNGEGHVPSLRRLVARGRYRDVKDLALALRFGETFGYDKLSSGGMAEIQSNLALLPEADLDAMAEYLVSLQ